MNILRRTVLFGTMAVACALAQSGTEAEVKKAESAWTTAVKAGDRAGLEKIMSDDLVYTHSTGVSETRTQYLDKLKSGAQKYAGLDYNQMKVRTWGNSAVVNGVLHMTGATNGTPFDNTVLVTHVWVKQGNAWKLVSHQTTKKAQ